MARRGNPPGRVVPQPRPQDVRRGHDTDMPQLVRRAAVVKPTGPSRLWQVRDVYRSTTYTRTQPIGQKER